MAKLRTETEQQAYEVRMRGLVDLLRGNAYELIEIVEPEPTKQPATEAKKDRR
jgi:hypothetical protein